MRKRSRVVALCPERSGTRVGSDIICVKLMTMAKASASRLAGLVTYEESELGALKAPKVMISEFGDSNVIVAIALER